MKARHPVREQKLARLFLGEPLPAIELVRRVGRVQPRRRLVGRERPLRKPGAAAREPVLQLVRD